MGTSPAQEQSGTAAASRFFWLWLFTATSMSVAGNVTHAIINAPRGTVALAAAAAVVTGIARYHNDPNTFAVAVVGAYHNVDHQQITALRGLKLRPSIGVCGFCRFRR